jgi:hypothetical protein
MKLHARRTLATFKSQQFNTSQTRDYFINPQCFGDDLARWLIRRLAAGGIATDDAPGQEDFGWFFCFTVNGTAFRLVLGYRPSDGAGEGTWIAWIERKACLVQALLGAQDRCIDSSAVGSINDALSDRETIADLRWHDRREFDAGQENRGSRWPDG